MNFNNKTIVGFGVAKGVYGLWEVEKVAGEKRGGGKFLFFIKKSIIESNFIIVSIILRYMIVGIILS